MTYCKDCFKGIQSKTARCPFCQSYQGRLNRIFSTPPYSVLLQAVPLGLMYFLFIFVRPFSINEVDNPQGLLVKNSSLKIQEQKFGTSVTILAEMDNTTDKSYEDIHFNVKIFNKSNEIVDAFSTRDFSLLIPQKNNIAFKIINNYKISIDSSQYNSAEIKVIKATKPWF